MTNHPKSSSVSRSAPLDILRAIAIFLVLGRHLAPCGPQVSPTLNAIGLAWIFGGWTGVDLFFVLSGFLISGLLFKEHNRTGSISFKNFFIRRGFKIYPPFYVMVAITTAWLLMAGHRVPFQAMMEEVFFFQNYGTGGFWGHEWSLAVEEHFYILLPLLLITIAAWNRTRPDPFRVIPKVFVVIALSCLCLRIYENWAVPFDTLTHLCRTHLRIDSLLFGVVVSYYYHYHTLEFKKFAQRFRPILLVLGILAFVPAFALQVETDVFVPTVGLTLLYVGSGLILVAVSGREPKPNRITRAIAFVGSRSYSIYLWHLPFQKAVVFKYLAQTYYSYAISYLVGSVVVGVAMYWLVEFPVLKIRDRLYPARTNVSPIAAASPSPAANVTVVG